MISMLAMTCVQAQTTAPFDVTEVTKFDEPWSMAFLPDGRLLVAEKKGRLMLVGQDGQSFGSVRGIPDVDYLGHGGLGDVVLHPEFEENGLVYLSYVEGAVGRTRGAAVARGVLTLTERRGTLSDLEVVWRQYPKMVGYGHYGHRIVFDDDGYLWISSGDRQKFTPSQDMQSNIGKIVRLHDDGSIPADNPFYQSTTGDRRAIWALGLRNPFAFAGLRLLQGMLLNSKIADWRFLTTRTNRTTESGNCGGSTRHRAT